LEVANIALNAEEYNFYQFFKKSHKYFHELKRHLYRELAWSRHSITNLLITRIRKLCKQNCGSHWSVLFVEDFAILVVLHLARLGEFIYLFSYFKFSSNMCYSSRGVNSTRQVPWTSLILKANKGFGTWDLYYGSPKPNHLSHPEGFEPKTMD